MKSYDKFWEAAFSEVTLLLYTNNDRLTAFDPGQPG